MVKIMHSSPSLHSAISLTNPHNWFINIFVTSDLVCAQYWPRDEVVEAWPPSGNEGPQIDGLFDVNQAVCVYAVCVCVYVYAKWFHDVFVSAMWWQQEDVWGNKKQQTDAYVASRTHTYTPPCPKAKTKGYSPHNSTVSRETYFFWLLWRY